MSNIKEIGTKLVALCREGKAVEAIESFYDANVVSIESSQYSPDFPRQIESKKAVLEKSKYWEKNTQVHSREINGPFPHGDDKFAVTFKIDATMDGMGRSTLEEVAVYEVKNGKIVKEEFFYEMGK